MVWLWDKIEIPRIKVGEKQTIETLIDEEALLLAKFLRNERKEWEPRTKKSDVCQKMIIEPIKRLKHVCRLNMRVGVCRIKHNLD